MYSENKRFFLIDALRSLAIINMIIYHLSYDINVVYGFNPSFPWGRGAHIYQQIICHSFILISGISWNFGRKKILRRGIIINLCGLLITLVTFIFMPSELIIFGILNCIGMCMILAVLFSAALRCVRPITSCLISLALFLIFRHIQDGYILGLNLNLFDIGVKIPGIILPKALYSSYLGIPFGLPVSGFVSSDYFPIIPWIFLYMSGIAIGRIILEHQKLCQLISVKIPLLSKMGRYSLPIYMLHQVICMGICILLFGMP